MPFHLPFLLLLRNLVGGYSLGIFRRPERMRDLGAGGDDGDNSGGGGGSSSSDGNKFCHVVDKDTHTKHGYYKGNECPWCKSDRLGETFDRMADQVNLPPGFQWPNCDCHCGCGRKGRLSGVAASPAGGRCTNCIIFCD